MSLPVGAFPTRTIKLSGGEVTVRGLSFAEGLQVRGEDASYTMIALSVGMDVSAVKEWANSTPAADVALLVETISDLSGFGEGAQKSG